MLLASVARPRFSSPLSFCTSNMGKKKQGDWVYLLLRAVTKEVWARKQRETLVLTVAWHYICCVYRHTSMCNLSPNWKRDEEGKKFGKPDGAAGHSGLLRRKGWRMESTWNCAWAWNVAEELSVYADERNPEVAHDNNEILGKALLHILHLHCITIPMLCHSHFLLQCIYW